MTLQRLMVLSLAGILSASAPNTRATGATISSVGTFSLPGFSTGTLGPVGSTPAVNNDDDPGASPNVIPYSVFLNSPGGLETEFVLQNFGGTTEYRFTQSFVNTPAASWKGFRFELGFGTGADFVPAGTGSSLQFDTLNGQTTATSPVFAVVMQQPNQLDWSVASPPFAAPFTFATDVPDGLAASNPSGQNRFTLRQTPLIAADVPEPAAFGTAGVALLAILMRRRYARRGRR